MMRIYDGERGRVGVATVAMVVITAVVKLLLEDKISTSWRKAIREGNEPRGARSRGGQPEKERN